MLESSRRRIATELAPDATVLDVGGWAKPLERADWVLDLLPYETRGVYGYDREASAPLERFNADTWVMRDMCDREPWPFEDGQFDFVVCSHTLEDIRDPIFVCREMQRVARAGYIEVPDRREEQTYGVNGAWVGWSHHRWIVEITGDEIVFVVKPGVLQGRPDLQMPRSAYAALPKEARVQQLWWSGSFAVSERVFHEPLELETWLAAAVPPGGAAAEQRATPSLGRRAISRLRRSA